MQKQEIWSAIDDLSEHDNPHIATWSESGDEFIILDNEKFAEFFKQSGFTSGNSYQYFKKQLNKLWIQVQKKISRREITKIKTLIHDSMGRRHV